MLIFVVSRFSKSVGMENCINLAGDGLISVAEFPHKHDGVSIMYHTLQSPSA